MGTPTGEEIERAERERLEAHLDVLEEHSSACEECARAKVADGWRPEEMCAAGHVLFSTALTGGRAAQLSLGDRAVAVIPPSRPLGGEDDL
jgi:hypothetical protein